MRPPRGEPAPTLRRAHIRTYGCQMNVYDSARMGEALRAAGYVESDDADAELVVLNTCHIRERAAEKVYSELGRLARLKRARRAAGREMVIAVAGCVAQAEGAEMMARARAIDVLVGPQTYHRLPALTERARRGERVMDIDFPEDDDKFAALDGADATATATAAAVARASAGEGAVGGRTQGALSAFLTVQEGCDKFCAFCVVPYTRGAEVSRPAADVIGEARRRVAEGAREITLLGQNVNAYHGEGAGGGAWSLGRLIRALAEIDGLWRIRYTTSHPRDMDDDLIAAHRDCAILAPYLHLPVQAGSNRVLKAMNRRHDADFYRRLIARIRAARPDIALSGDFIVGFPGETDADFEETMRLVAEIGYASAYSFKYSPRPGTPAADAADMVPEAVATARLHRLQALLTEQQRAFNAAQLGRRLEVLFDKAGRNPGQIGGRSPYLQPVHVDAPASLIGRMAEVEIVGLEAHSLAGRLTAPAPAASATSEAEAEAASVSAPARARASTEVAG